MSLWNIFDYRMRVHKLRYLIKDMIIGKIDLYSCLYSKQVDYKTLSSASKTLNDHLLSTKKELSFLISRGPKNVKLCREAIMYELCVLEKTYISSKLRNLYTDALEDNRNRFGSIKSGFKKQSRFNLYRSSNIVVFARNKESVFVVHTSTPNAQDLFGVSRQELVG